MNIYCWAAGLNRASEILQGQRVANFEKMWKSFNPLTPWAFCQKCILWAFGRFSGLDMGQISSNLLEKAFATWQHAFLSTSIAFYDIFARACAEIRILRWFLDKKVTYVLRLFEFLNFFSPFPFLLFLSFCCSDWPSTGLACSSKNSEKASSRWAISTVE